MEGGIENIILNMGKGNIVDEVEHSVRTCSQGEHWISRDKQLFRFR